MPGGFELRPILKNAIVPKIANAMNTIAVITGRLIAKRVNHTIEIPLLPCSTPGTVRLFQPGPKRKRIEPRGKARVHYSGLRGSCHARVTLSQGVSSRYGKVE